MKSKAKITKIEVAILLLPILFLVALGVRFTSKESRRHTAFMKKVRLDGLYVSTDKQYVQFYKDETVTAASCDTFWPKYVAQKLNSYQHADYVIDNEEVQFSVLFPEYKKGKVDYAGRFEGQDLVLHRYDHMKEREFVTRYRFVKVK